MKKTLVTFITLVGLGTLVNAQTLLYEWNFDNATGSGTSLSFAPSAGSGTLGTLTDANAGLGLSTPAGSGVSGAAGDLGFVQSSAYGTAGAGALSGQLGDLSAVSSFTVTLWFNLAANATANPLNSRLFTINSGAGGDGNRLYISLNTGTNLQFGVNTASTGVILGTGGTSPFGSYGLNFPGGTMTNTWFFVGASYTTAAGGTVNIYEGTSTTAATLAGTLTGVGNIAWDASGDYANVGNRPSNGQRNLPGTIDDVGLYSGAGDLTFIDGIQNVPEPGTLALIGLGFGSLAAMIRRRQVCNKNRS